MKKRLRKKRMSDLLKNGFGIITGGAFEYHGFDKGTFVKIIKPWHYNNQIAVECVNYEGLEQTVYTEDIKVIRGLLV